MTAPDGNGFTQKEMLIRIEAKLDTALGEVTAVKLRQAVLEQRVNDAELARNIMRQEVDRLEKGQNNLARKLAYATATVSALVLVANWLVPVVVKRF